jgi:D-xylose transport system permease protein
VLAAILVGAAVGLVQGAVVVFGAPSFVVTLGGSLIMSGVLLLLLPSAGQINLADNPISNLANTFLAPWLGWALACAALAFFAWLRWSECPGRERSELLREVAAPLALAAVVVLALVGVFSSYQGVPLAVAIFLGLLLALWYVTKQTRFGTYLYAIGGNREAARRAGVHVGRLRLATFVIAGACAALAGVLAASRLLGVSTQAGGGPLLLQAVAAAVIGGASLFGGRGSVWAALLGALVIGSISNGLDLLGSADEVKLIVQGAILIIAVTLDAVISRGSLRPSAGRLPR